MNVTCYSVIVRIHGKHHFFGTLKINYQNNYIYFKNFHQLNIHFLTKAMHQTEFPSCHGYEQSIICTLTSMTEAKILQWLKFNMHSLLATFFYLVKYLQDFRWSFRKEVRQNLLFIGQYVVINHKTLFVC